MSLSKAASNVLFNEDYLDMILPYLSTSDLKSVRLVTPFWNKIGTKFLGRKSFKPINFSHISHEYWLILRREIEAFGPEEDPRIKLFQGFHLTWVDVAIMDYCNFMAPFRPSQIIIERRDVSPGSSLTSLLTSILDTLTDVTLKIKWDILNLKISFLENFANLEGMRLKRLHLELCPIDVDSVYLYFQGEPSRTLQRILSDLLSSQAPTLEELDLKICIAGGYYEVQGPLFQLPIFHRLTYLNLDLGYRNLSQENMYYPDIIYSFIHFQPFDFGQIFPNLLHLELSFNFLNEMNEKFDQVNTFELTRGHPLKKIKINTSIFPYNTSIELFNKFRISFPQVEEFASRAQGLLVSSRGEEIPWVDTLRNLEISGRSPTFNFLHLKKIEILHYTLEYGVVVNGVNGLINMLMEHYQELPHLKKFHISGYKITAEQMNQIQEALPAQFLEIITID